MEPKQKLSDEKRRKMAEEYESKLNWIHRFCVNVLKRGPIPRHIAFIMDGNRRYALKNGIRKLEAHNLGFKKLTEVGQWCNSLGITEATLYMFSIENFKRTQEEIDTLMNLAEEKYYEVAAEKEQLAKYGVCIRLLGDISYLPVKLQKILADLLLYTRHNSKFRLNVCLAYTSREEITDAVKEMAIEVIENRLKTSDINENLLDAALYSSKSTDPDLLIRTSGEIRLSDFLLWQSDYSVLSFLKVLWPDFKIWHLFLAVLYYQYYYPDMKAKKGKHSSSVLAKEREQDTYLARNGKAKLNESQGKEKSFDEVSKVLDDIEARRKSFISHLDDKRYENFNKIKNGNAIQNKAPVS